MTAMPQTTRAEMRGPLLGAGIGAVAGDDMELTRVTPVTVAQPADPLTSRAKIHVVRTGWMMHLIGAALFAALLIPTALIAYVMLDSWKNNPANRSWLILGLGFYIGAALKGIYEALVRVYHRLWFLRVEIRRVMSATLFDAVSNILAEEAELDGETCSWDTEASQEHDDVTGEYSVKLRFWGSCARNLRVRIEDKDDMELRLLSLDVQYDPGTDIVCGRDARLHSQATLVLSIRTTRQRAQGDKAVLRKWLEEAYNKWMQPTDRMVRIYGLQQSSTDWVPEWKLERMKPCKSVAGTGQSFYLQSDALMHLLSDAKLWPRTNLRVYMVSGPPGVGKSEFILWLASQLGLPIYRLCLSSSSLSDNLLAQLLSQSSITDNSVLLQIDEFQETLHRWLASSEANPQGGVSAGGFCECLQGAAAMRSGVIIISGTSELSSAKWRTKLAAVRRRIHCEAQLTWMTKQDVRLYFRKFLLKFVPGACPEDWDRWENEFLQDEPWGGQMLFSVDTMRQFLMAQITEASVRGIGEFDTSIENIFQVKSERRADFFELICHKENALCFLNTYTPIAVADEDVEQGSEPSCAETRR